MDDLTRRSEYPPHRGLEDVETIKLVVSTSSNISRVRVSRANIVNKCQTAQHLPQQDVIRLHIAVDDSECDVKPDNIMLFGSRCNNAKLADFGFATFQTNIEQGVPGTSQFTTLEMR